ncbi:ABC transporter permease [Blastococcus sp. Marseille-P5729]|uniref:ABC transporter permease n=1 Tax=Blastococcus sp. Marseille-P5729 TaxID=2086582 RepID=UPI000D0EB2C2|nr:ABC transporter permease [Blastococcus sp. Marseille-P5729]
MNPTFVWIELKRIFRNVPALFFTAVLPAFMYIVFGATQDYKDQRVGNGNVAMFIMVSMAVYGAVTATTSIGGSAAVERMQGWGRQLGLTPMRDSGYVSSKAMVAIIIALIPIALIYAIGASTGADATASAWVLTAVLCVLGSAIFALFGLAIGAAFRSEAAVSAAGGSIVILGFLGNVFIPLSGTMLAIAKFTPLYGVAALARYPVTEGYLASGDGASDRDELWEILLNVGGWTLIFAVLAIVLVRKGRNRQ